MFHEKVTTTTKHSSVSHEYLGEYLGKYLVEYLCKYKYHYIIHWLCCPPLLYIFLPALVVSRMRLMLCMKLTR